MNKSIQCAERKVCVHILTYTLHVLTQGKELKGGGSLRQVWKTCSRSAGTLSLKTQTACEMERDGATLNTSSSYGY